MKYAQSVTYFRQLCCMGLRSEIVMPALLEAIHRLVPADFNSFFWAGEDYGLCNMYSENFSMYQFAPVYFEEYYNNKEINAIGVGFSDAMRRGHLFGNSEQFGKKFINTDMYNDLWSVVHIRHVLEVTACERGRGWGVLKLARGSDARPFTQAEEIRLKTIAPYIAHAIKAPFSEAGAMVGTGESGMIVVDRKNQVVQFSDEGKSLFHLATNSNLAAPSKTELTLPNSLQKICDDLRCVMSGEAKRLPVYFHSSPWGIFVFRAYSLNASNGKDNGWVALHIERQTPMQLRLMQSSHMRALTGKEREACLLLSQGLSHSDIALRMHIKPSTVIDYVRNIYRKLGVHNQKELFEMFNLSKTNTSNNSTTAHFLPDNSNRSAIQH